MNHKAALNKSKAWGKILLAIAGLILFIYVIGPMGLKAPMIKPMADFIEKNSINANGYYYTEVAEFSDAEIHMKHTFGYPPMAKKKP